MTAILECRGISKAFGALQALGGVDLTLEDGEILGLIGPNGAGKTTLIKTIVGLLRPRAGGRGGRIAFKGERIDGLRPEEIVRRGIAVVPEGAKVFPEMTVRDNLLMGAVVPHARGRREENLRDLHALFPRLAEREGQLARTLSGGEQQMLAIGRALMACPDLLLDEPSLGLQPTLVKSIMETIRGISARGITVLLIEQNVHISLPMSTRGYVLENGRVALESAGADLLTDPHVRSAYLGI